MESMLRHKHSVTRTEYHWDSEIAYKIAACRGGGSCKDAERITFVDRKRSSEIITLTKDSGMREKTIQEPIELNLTWLIQNMGPSPGAARFKIDRENNSCRTPVWNHEMQDSVSFAKDVKQWASQVARFFTGRVQNELVARHVPTKPENTITLSNVGELSLDVFNPILPLVDNHTALSQDTAARFLEEHIRTMEDKALTLGELFPASESAHLISIDEASLSLVCQNIKSLATQFLDSVGYIEDSLDQQLFAAIGRSLTAKDFDDFMDFYYSKFFHSKFAPKSFSRSIRRPDHFPDGMLSFEDSAKNAVKSIVRYIPGDESTSFEIPIGAATSVEIKGDQYLHGWMQHQFLLSSSSFHLTARAHQFSSFMLIVGTIAGPNKFIPKNAIILRNKDEVLIPILTDVLPSAKEFQDAVKSLSPEQQEFTMAFRNMQLESSVFGVCVVQIKPQLEKLLGLPDDALTKEIVLTQNILSLFVDYQIPSDLLSFDGPSSASASEKITDVKGYVSAVMGMIETTKEKQLQEEKRKADLKRQQMDQEYEALSAGDQAKIPAPPSEEWDLDSVPGGEGQAGTGGPPPEYPPMDFYVPSLSHTALPSSKNTEAVTFRQGAVAVDFTSIPKMLDSNLKEHDKQGAMKSVVISAGPTWDRSRQENLSKSTSLNPGQVERETKNAMDLLQSLSRSGSLPIDTAEFHIVIGLAHCFERSIIDTVIEDNVNPIASVEKSLVLGLDAARISPTRNCWLGTS